MDIFYVDSECGAGKTYAMHQHIISTPSLYIVAVPKVDLIHEQESALGAIRPSGMRVKAIYAEGGNLQVGSRITKAMEDWIKLGIGHGVIFISHEALNLVEWTRTSIQPGSWHLFIDEAPCPWAYYNQLHPVTNPDVRALLAWEPLPANSLDECEALKPYVQISLSEKGERLLASGTDAMRSAYAPLLNTVRRGKIAVGNRSFFEPDGSSESTKLSVFSLTDPHRFSVFRSATILSANFRHTFAHLLWSGNTVNFIPHPTLAIRRDRAVPLHARTRIFSFGSKDASLNWFKDDCQPITVAGLWLGTSLNRPFYYAVNEGINDPIRSIHGQKVAPIAIGSNSLTDMTAAAWLVSLKAKPLEYATIRTVFGISRDQFDRTREHEALYQFALRSNLRDFSSTTPVDLYVVSDRQAQYLCEVLGVPTFERVGVTLPEPAKVMTASAPRGRPRVHQTAEDAKRAKRDRDREAKRLKRGQQRQNQQQQEAA